MTRPALALALLVAAVAPASAALNRPGTPAPRPPAATAPQGGAQNPGSGLQTLFVPDFSVVNRGRSPIVELNVSPVESQSWGHNLVHAARIEIGRSFMVRLPRDGRCMYDVRVKFQDGREAPRRQQNVCAINEMIFAEDGVSEAQAAAAAPARRPVAPARPARPEIALVNASAQEIRAVQASPVTDSEWGENRLRGRAVPPGQRFELVISRAQGCRWDVRVTYADGSRQDLRSQDLCALAELRFAGRDPAIRRISAP